METIAGLIEKYGTIFYIITFVWTFFEGETFVIFAGALCVPGLAGENKTLLNIYILTAVAWGGSFCGDQCWFALGRFGGKWLLRKFPRFQGGVQLAIDMLHKYHTFFILTYRYMYGVRNFASIGMGMTDLPWARFAVLNFIAAGIWAISFAGGGYLLGMLAADWLRKVNFAYVMIGVVVFVVIVFAIMHWRGKKKFKAAVARSQAEHAAKAQAETDVALAGAKGFSKNPERH